jgi:hypothetical protein
MRLLRGLKPNGSSAVCCISQDRLIWSRGLLIPFVVHASHCASPLLVYSGNNVWNRISVSWPEEAAEEAHFGSTLLH